MAIATPTVDSGYDYQFVNTPPDRTHCIICHLPSRDPYLTECCGHVLCKCCLDKTRTTGCVVCPMCNDEKFITFSNKQLDREIKGLHVYCTNKEKGCEWHRELNEVNDHLGNSNGCQYEEVTCTVGCGKVMQRQHLTSHVETECPCRSVNCQYCHDAGEHQFIEGPHKDECPKYPMPCPNKCEIETVSRGDMEVHKSECPLEMIQCDYYSVGCEARMARKARERHDDENVKEHLMMTKLKLAKTEDALSSNKDKLISTEEKLTSTEEKLTSTEGRLSKVEVMMQQLINKTWSNHLVAMATSTITGTQCCPVIVKMSQYDGNMKNAVYWCSESFFTHHRGYKMRISADATGVGDFKGSHLSAFLYLMEGSYDNELTWPLRGEFKLVLLNQISDSEHHSVSITFDATTPGNAANRIMVGDKTSGWGYKSFISNKDLHKTTTTRQFLKDDSLFFQLTCKL